MELLIGTKRWSTWTLRPWLVLKRVGEPFTETTIQLRQAAGGTAAAIRPHSPSGMIPLLKDGDLAIWDSLAICEYLAERFPQAKLWPDDPAARALGRAAVAEMHSGFTSLRGECPMALETPPRVVEISELTQANVRRIVALWRDFLERFGGPFLLGDWSIADAYYTPVATRLRGYGIRPSDYGDTGAAGAYAERLLEQPEFLEWERAAQAGL